MHRLFAFITSFLVATSTFAAPDFSDCLEFFPSNTPPVAQQLNDNTKALCFSGFAVLYSSKSRTPIYVAERLNKQTLLSAKDIERTNKYYSEARLPSLERAELDDYIESGFDRGHMAPAGDMVTEEAMAQSFSLANIIPQSPINNQHAWAGIEKATRKYVMRASGDVFVITGTVFDDKPQTIGFNRIWVPRYLYKLVYDKTANKTWAHWIENTDDARAGKPISYEELVKRTGIQFLHGVK